MLKLASELSTIGALRRRAGGLLRVGLLNNMPDAALERTEHQFGRLLERAAEQFAVELALYSLRDVPRGPMGRERLRLGYGDERDLFRDPPDALIVTGTEPRAPSLKNEPYWGALASVLDWTVQERLPTILSCLAAHAAVLHFDGVERRRLEAKCCGVFSHAKAAEHPLTRTAPQRFGAAHSRWNTVDEADLRSCGYRVLTRAPCAGVDMFIREHKTLQVFFQGHPEYSPDTLLREYRRDVRRFLRRETELYPATPSSYFALAELEQLACFQRLAADRRDEEMLSRFPLLPESRPSESPPDAPAIRLYAGWLAWVAEHKACASALPCL